jgi:hypothetical protein
MKLMNSMHATSTYHNTTHPPQGERDDVIVKSGNKCPSGYSNTQGGHCKR